MTNKTKDSIRSAFLEAMFVVLGVVLALAANEWRQGRADHRQSEQALASITEELKANREAIAASMEYHHGLMEMLTAKHEEGWAPQPRIVGEIIYAELFRGGTAAIADNYKNFLSIIGTFAYREEQMLALYDEINVGIDLTTDQ